MVHRNASISNETISREQTIAKTEEARSYLQMGHDLHYHRARSGTPRSHCD